MTFESIGGDGSDGNGTEDAVRIHIPQCVFVREIEILAQNRIRRTEFMRRLQIGNSVEKTPLLIKRDTYTTIGDKLRITSIRRIQAILSPYIHRKGERYEQQHDMDKVLFHGIIYAKIKKSEEMTNLVKKQSAWKNPNHQTRQEIPHLQMLFYIL